MKVICYLLDVAPLAEDFNGWLSRIPEDRQEKCMRYLKTEDRLLSLGGSLLIETFVGKGKYHYGEYGKPYKRFRPAFSLSHSGHNCLLAVAQHEVGTDIQLIEEKDGRMIEYCFDEEERERIHSNEDFFDAWSEKEALGKLLGFGLRDPKKTPVKRLGKNKVRFEGHECFTHVGRIGGYSYAIASETQMECVLENVKLENLQKPAFRVDKKVK